MMNFVFIFSAVSFVTAVSISKHEYSADPIRRVKDLLAKMRDNLHSDSETDETTHKKFMCWVKENRNTCNERIPALTDEITSLSASIERGTAKAAQLTEEIEDLVESIERNVDSLNSATSIRAKQLADFQKEETDLVASIKSIEAALVILSKHNGAESALQAANLLQKVLDHSTITGSSRGKTSRKIVGVLTQLRGPEGGYWDKKAIGSGDYTSQSGGIFGTLQQMSDNFKNDLKVARDTEATQAAEFDEFKASKDNEIAQGRKSKDSKTAEKTKTQFQLRDDKQAKKDASKDLENFQNLLATVNDAAKDEEAEYAARVKTRSDELTAITQALKILDSDETRDLLRKVVRRTGSEASFLQQTPSVKSIVSRLRRMGSPRVNSIAIALLNTHAKNEAFTEVLKAIDQMISDLRKQQADEAADRDTALSLLHENEKETLETRSKIDTANANIERLVSELEIVANQIKEIQENIDAQNVAIKEAGENRAAENSEFQASFDENQQAQVVMEKVIQVLQKFYGANLALLEGGVQYISSEPVGTPAPKSHDPYKKQDNAVVHLLNAILEDTKTQQKQAVTAEQNAQTTYEKFIKSSNIAIDQLGLSLADAHQSQASLTEQKLSNEQSKKEGLANMLDLQKALQDIQNSFGFILKNFDITQQARADEMEALRQAKAVLQGSDATLESE